ncbi:MAG: hypothetical protein NC416_01715 [Eubacterium sp.]|nr:hypothetical protein [Eubacterium sp.]
MKSNLKVWFVLPVRCLLFIAIFSFCSMITQKKLTEITHWWTCLASIINIITIVILWIICKRDNTTYREMIHYDQRQGNFWKGFLFVVIMLLIGIGGMYFAGVLCYGEFPYLAPMMIAPISPHLALLNILILPLTTTIAEDGMYLGYGVNSFTSKWAAVLIPAFFYALQHSFIPTVFDMKFMLYRFLSFLPLTIWICFQYHRKGCISYIMTGHWILNIATTIQIAITSFYPEFYAMLSDILP